MQRFCKHTTLKILERKQHAFKNAAKKKRKDIKMKKGMVSKNFTEDLKAVDVMHSS